MKVYNVIVLILVLASCSNPQSKYLKFLIKDMAESQENFYQESKKQYFDPKEIFSHFPDKTYESYPARMTISMEDQPYHYYLLFCFNNNSSFLKEKEKKAKKLAKENFMPNDTSQYYVIQSNTSYSKIQYLLHNSIPIPDFRYGKSLVEGSGSSFGDSMIVVTYFSDKYPCGLTEDYDIYVIDTQNKYKTYSEEYKDIFAALPRINNAGFARGICINRKVNVIIFWTMIF